VDKQPAFTWAEKKNNIYTGENGNKIYKEMQANFHLGEKKGKNPCE